MWYHRDIKDKIHFLASKFPAVILTGARQTGKTSLLKGLFQNHNYVSLDVPSLADKAENDPELFLADHPAPLVIDEVQYAPRMFRFLKIAIDRDRHQMGQFIVTGSQKFVLMKEVSESLAGRCAILDLETLSFHELTQKEEHKGDLSFLTRLLMRGGYPELWRDESIPSKEFYESYLITYLERDVRQILNVSSLRDFERFMRACAARNGQLLDQSALAADIGVSLKAIRSWLSVMEASNQIAILEPWFANIGKRLVKTPKLFFCDVGFVSFLLGADAESLNSRPYIGALWETLVFSEIRKRVLLQKRPISLWFFRDRQQHEVDFLLAGGGRTALIEAKWKEFAETRDFRMMEKVIQFGKDKATPEFRVCKSFLICRTPEFTTHGDERFSLPLKDVDKCFV